MDKKNTQTTVKNNELTVKKLRTFCHDHKVSLTFMSECLGMHPTTIAGWDKDGEVPERYLARVLDIMISIKHLRSGKKLVPVGTEYSGDLRKKLNVAVDILKALDDPIAQSVIGLLRSAKEDL